MRNASIEAIAKEYYDSRLPYHNFGHIERALAAAETILERCRNANVPINEQVVYLAVLFHDAGYYNDHLKAGFPHKEAYSADIAERELLKNDFEPKIVDAVKGAILATHREAAIDTIEQKAVRAADLATMALDYDGFRRDAENLKKEIEVLTGSAPSVAAWKKSVESHIDFYLHQIIHITSSPETFISDFHIHTKKNLERFLREE